MPGSDSSTAKWARSAGWYGGETGFAAGLASTGDVVVAGTFADDMTAFTGASLPYPSDPNEDNDFFVADIAQGGPTGQGMWEGAFGGVGNAGAPIDFGALNESLRMALDKSDDIVLAGAFQGSMTIGATVLASDATLDPGTVDGFVARLKKDGTPIWAERFGGPADESVMSLALTSTGDPLVAWLSYGGYDGTGGGPSSLTVSALGCTTPGLSTSVAEETDRLFVVRLSASDGTCVWGHSYDIDNQFLDTNNSGYGIALTVDPFDDVIVAGGAGSGGVNFGNGFLVMHGGVDVFVAKLDPAGNLVWASSYGGPDDEWVRSVGTDGCGNIFLGGGFDNSVVLGPTVSFTLPAVSPDAGADVLDLDHMFIARLDIDPNDKTTGKAPTPVWNHGLWDYGWQEITAMAVNHAADFAIVGVLLDAPESQGVDFGDGHPAPPQQVSNITNVTDGFVAKFDATGSLKWTYRYTGPNYEHAYGVAMNDKGNTVVTGDFEDTTLDFGNGLSVQSMYANAFVVEYGP